MDQSHPQRRQRFRKKLRCLLGSLALQHIRFLDQRANPVGLLPPLTGQPHPCQHFITSCRRNSHRLNRLTTRRQLINHRTIQIGIGRHHHGARNRGSCHDQLMRHRSVIRPLVPQRKPLMHTKTMLFVDNNQSRRGKIDRLPEQGMCTDNQLRRTLPDRGQHLMSLRRRQTSR